MLLAVGPIGRCLVGAGTGVSNILEDFAVRKAESGLDTSSAAEGWRFMRGPVAREVPDLQEG